MNEIFVPKQWYKYFSYFKATYTFNIPIMLNGTQDENILKTIGEKLYDARMNYMGTEGKKRALGKPGISLRDLAAVAKVKHTQIEAIEKGRTNATILTLIAIASVLQVDLCELLSYKTTHKRNKKQNN